MEGDEPALLVRRPAGPARAVALVLHGGAQFGAGVVRPWGLAYLRMVPLARALYAAGAAHGLEVRLLRNRVRGWNEPALDPVLDARWALGRLRAEHPGLPVVLVGHSMGGRVALRVADDPAVVGVCALAPWTPGDEPVEPVRGRSVLIAHGTQDRVTGPADSYAYAVRAEASAARLARFEVTAEGHAMLRRPPVWSRLVAEFTLRTLELPFRDGLVTSAWTKPPAQRLRIPL
ncbi:alpha/beta hydrolase [Qaidamihabitans albus]|uniref:alpha/beta hydrolase n=1 Tax=Qaidamihabitans albus TaxID=2795733 RepID=UPI0018F2006F|nr:alpha/beta fold hydrolase [Qaidamihabitans albus]